MHAYFKTDRFRRALSDDEVDAVVLGEDCIEWLRTQLNGSKDMATERPILEDWGWTMALSVDGSRLWLNVQDWSFEQDKTWHLWIEPRGILARITAGSHGAACARLRQAIDEVLSAESAICEVRWSEVKPR